LPGTERDHLGRLARQPPHHQLTALAVDDRRDDLARVHVQPNPAANLCHVGTPMNAVAVEGQFLDLHNPRTFMRGCRPLHPDRTDRTLRPTVHMV
jgi:hypothetical protein